MRAKKRFEKTFPTLGILCRILRTGKQKVRAKLSSMTNSVDLRPARPGAVILGFHFTLGENYEVGVQRR